MKARTGRQGITDDPLTYTLQLCRQQQMSAWKYIANVLYTGEGCLSTDIGTRKGSLLTSTSSKDRANATLNPQFSVHPVYLCSSSTSSAPEHLRMEFSKIRLSIHNLRIEIDRGQIITRELRVTVQLVVYKPSIILLQLVDIAAMLETFLT